jgi:uncharacterized protein YqgC (DUF456 family)
MTIALWALAIALIVIGVAGTVLPALPGIAFVYGGIVLAAWIENFAQISVTTLVVLGVLAAIGFAIDYVAAAVSAQRAGASKLGLAIGVLFMPLVGAAIGEWLEHRDALRAGSIGMKTWIGIMLGNVAKLAIVFAMLGIFVLALVL